MKALRQIFSVLCLLALLGLSSCDFSAKIKGFTDLDYNDFTIRPLKVDMNNVAGFAVMQNTQAGQPTKASNDDTPDAPYALYSVDKNGNISLSVFKFEVKMTQNAEGDTIAETIKRVFENAVQVVPYHIHDFGKYLLFSGCSYQIDKKALTDEEYDYLSSHPDIEMFTWQGVKTFMLRKNDGALFDLSAAGKDAGGDFWNYTEAPYFLYWANWGTLDYEHWQLMPRLTVEVASKDGVEFGLHNPKSLEIPVESYNYSPSGNLYTYAGSVYSFTDKGDAMDVACLTQTLSSARFLVDNQENVFSLVYKPLAAFEIYYAQGGFNSIAIDPNASSLSYFDYQADDKGTNYLFYTTAEAASDGGIDQWFKVMAIKDGNCQLIYGGQDIWGACQYHLSGDLDWICRFRESIRYQCLGYQNGCFRWFAMSDESASTDDILVYDTENNQVRVQAIPANIEEALASPCDAKVLIGAKCYLVNALTNAIQVKEVDVVANAIRDYSFDADLSEFVAKTYSISTLQSQPYFKVSGRSNKSGANISFSINVITGDNTATFAHDNRSLVTYLRIN